MINFIPYHSDQLKNSPLEFHKLDPSFEGNALSLIDESGICQAVFGLVLTLGGIPKLGVLISPGLKKNKNNHLALNRWSKRAVPHMLDFFNLPFIEVDTYKNNPINNRWVTFLGFEFYETNGNINTYRYIKR